MSIRTDRGVPRPVTGRNACPTKINHYTFVVSVTAKTLPAYLVPRPVIRGPLGRQSMYSNSASPLVAADRKNLDQAHQVVAYVGRGRSTAAVVIRRQPVTREQGTAQVICLPNRTTIPIQTK